MLRCFLVSFSEGLAHKGRFLVNTLNLQYYISLLSLRQGVPVAGEVRWG
jgi:hypothetical protein